MGGARAPPPWLRYWSRRVLDVDPILALNSELMRLLGRTWIPPSFRITKSEVSELPLVPRV